MKIKYGLCVMLSCNLLYGADTTTKMPAGNYYEGSHLAYLNEHGIRKHAPLSIITDQNGQEDPGTTGIALTLSLANILQTAFIPTIVSHSIVHNYFIRRDRNMENFNPQENPVSFDEWYLYDIPNSSYFLFVPRHYMRYYNGFGFNLRRLVNISATLPIKGDYRPIIQYIESHMQHLPFSVYDLKTALTSIKQSFGVDSKTQLTKQELKDQDPQQPIWDIILNGHGTYKGHIAGLKTYQIPSILDFFNNELTIGTVYIQSCSAGGANLNLLEFDTTVNKERVLRNLDYILIVGSITDEPTFYGLDRTMAELYYQFYNNAARLQDAGKTLNILINSLYTLKPRWGSLHGSSNIPQVWLPGGLGFQTYQINDKIQILGNINVRVHEDEHQAIRLPASTIVSLMYTTSINVPLLIWPHTINPTELSYLFRYNYIPALAQILKATTYNDDSDLRKKIGSSSHTYPALMRILTTLKSQYAQSVNKAIDLIYPEFISMLRGNRTTQYINKIELQQPIGTERELTGVMHFIRDAFFDINERHTTKTFLIEELTGNNDISASLELYRLDNNTPAHRWLQRRKDIPHKVPNQGSLLSPNSLELKLRSSIGKQITLEKISITTVNDRGSLQFMYGGIAWNVDFKLQNANMQSNFFGFWGGFKQIDAAEYEQSFIASKNKIMPEPTEQKSIREVLLEKAATYQAFRTTRAPIIASTQSTSASQISKPSAQRSPASGSSARSTQEQREAMLRDFKNVEHDIATTIQNIKKVFPTATIESDIKQIVMQYLNQIKIAKQDIDTHSESIPSLKASIDRYTNAKDALDLLVIFGSTRQDILNTVTIINTKSKTLKMNPNVIKAININVNKAKDIRLYITTLPEVIYADDIENLYRMITEYMDIKDNLMNIARL